MKNIAFLGLGEMGQRMMPHLLNAGYQVSIWNRTKSKASHLLTIGAKWANTPAEAARTADAVISMVRDDEASKEVWLNEASGAFSTLKDSALAIESSTLSLEHIRLLASAANEKSIPFIEAPVSGSLPQAHSGQLVFFVGAAAESFSRVYPLLSHMGSTINHVGNVGNAVLAKLCTNTMLGVQVAVLSELLALITDNNGDRERILSALQTTSSWSPAATGISTMMVQENHQPMFPIQLILKDFDYTSKATKQLSPLIETTRQQFSQAKISGFGLENMTALKKLFHPSQA